MWQYFTFIAVLRKDERQKLDLSKGGRALNGAYERWNSSGTDISKTATLQIAWVSNFIIHEVWMNRWINEYWGVYSSPAGEIPRHHKSVLHKKAKTAGLEDNIVCSLNEVYHEVNKYGVAHGGPNVPHLKLLKALRWCLLLESVYTKIFRANVFISMQF